MPVNYYLEKRASKKNEHPIRLSAVVKGVRILSTTGFSVDGEYWDAEHMRVKPHQTNSKKQTSAHINKYLSGIENAVLEFENTCRTRPSIDKLKEVINSYNPDADPNAEEGEEQDNTPMRPSAITYFDEFVKEQSIECQWTAGTMQCWAAFRRHLSDNIKGKSFDCFNDDGINAFVRFLRVHEKMEEKTVQPKFKVVEKPVIFPSTSTHSPGRFLTNTRIANSPVASPFR